MEENGTWCMDTDTSVASFVPKKPRQTKKGLMEEEEHISSLQASARISSSILHLLWFCYGIGVELLMTGCSTTETCIIDQIDLIFTFKGS